MTLEQNKQAAMEFFRRFDADDIDGALATMADDVSWWLAGKPSRFRVGGAKTKAQMAEIFRAMRARLKDGLRMFLEMLTIRWNHLTGKYSSTSRPVAASR